MNRQAKELTKAMLSTIASLLLSVKNTVIEYQTKLFPLAKAFLGLCLSGNSGRLLLIATACLATGGCSTALITTGVLDRPAQERMFSAVDRAGLEALAKKPIASKTTADGKNVDLYSYVDGEAGVIGRRGRPMHGERVGRAVMTVLTSGYFEVLMVPVALLERSEATRKFYVVYAPDNRILAVCYPNYPVDVPGREDSLCNSEPAPEATKRTITSEVAG
jgi:hypothetical protein